MDTPEHFWGDAFKWDRLSEAMTFFQDVYKKLTGKDALIKEKYGTMRLECESTWIETAYDADKCKLALLCTAYKYPEVCQEVLADYLMWELDADMLEFMGK